jgi:phosphatidylinositol alpha-mannosyltransferase
MQQKTYGQGSRNERKDRKMRLKVGLVSPYGWNRPGGVREHVRHLAAQLTHLGHDARILAPALQTEDLLPAENVYNMGQTIPFSMNGAIAHITLDPRMHRRVERVFQREAFDIVHIHEPLLPGLSLQALRASNAITVGTFHAFPQEGRLSAPSLAYTAAAPFLRPYFRRLAGRITVSSAAYQFISRFFPANYSVIPNGVDLERFHPRVAPLPHLMDGKQNILFVGRFDWRKGARYLVEAIPLVRAFYPNTRFLFIGEGPLRRGLQEFVRKRGWHEVVFTGYVPAELLPGYFASAHLFCAPAVGSESLGIVLLEAMASGVPIVATNIPGYATVVKSGTDGLLTPPRNSVELSRAILHMLDHEALRRQFISRGLLKARDYAWPRVAQRIAEFYLQLLTTNEKGRIRYATAT